MDKVELPRIAGINLLPKGAERRQGLVTPCQRVHCPGRRAGDLPVERQGQLEGQGADSGNR
jgi:hypothetical protein